MSRVSCLAFYTWLLQYIRSVGNLVGQDVISLRVGLQLNQRHSWVYLAGYMSDEELFHYCAISWAYIRLPEVGDTQQYLFYQLYRGLSDRIPNYKFIAASIIAVCPPAV